MREMLISTCAGKSCGTDGTLGKHSYSWGKERDLVYPLVCYEPCEGYTVLSLGEGKWLGRGAGVSRSDRESVALTCLPFAHTPLVSSDARNMARDVQNTFYEIVAEFGNMSQPQAVDYIKKLMTKGRYSLDVWS